MIYCESGRIGPYFPDFSANRTTMHLQIEKIWPRFPTFSLRSFLPRRLLAKLKRVQFGVADVDSQLNRLAGQRADIALPAVRPALKTVLASTPARGRRDRSLPDPRQRPGSGDHRGRLDHRSHSDRSTVHRVPSRHRHLVGDKTPKAIGVRVRLSRTR